MVFIRHLSRIIQQESNLLPFFFQSPFTYPLSIFIVFKIILLIFHSILLSFLITLFMFSFKTIITIPSIFSLTVRQEESDLAIAG